jgi:hypothetical protein
MTLREERRSTLVFRGFGTLVAGAVLFVLMLLIAPSVAPEHVVDRPASSASTSSSRAPGSTTATTSAASTTTTTTGPAAGR